MLAAQRLEIVQSLGDDTGDDGIPDVVRIDPVHFQQLAEPDGIFVGRSLGLGRHAPLTEQAFSKKNGKTVLVLPWSIARSSG